MVQQLIRCLHDLHIALGLNLQCRWSINAGDIYTSWCNLYILISSHVPVMNLVRYMPLCVCVCMCICVCVWVGGEGHLAYYLEFLIYCFDQCCVRIPLPSSLWSPPLLRWRHQGLNQVCLNVQRALSLESSAHLQIVAVGYLRKEYLVLLLLQKNLLQ